VVVNPLGTKQARGFACVIGSCVQRHQNVRKQRFDQRLAGLASDERSGRVAAGEQQLGEPCEHLAALTERLRGPEGLGLAGSREDGRKVGCGRNWEFGADFAGDGVEGFHRVC
jgi:hypothetical protein